MYALLPAMCGASQEMHMQAIDQMVQYYQGDEDELRNQLLCFGVMMRRAELLPAIELEEVLKKMKDYDPLIAEDPYLQALAGDMAEKLVAEAKAEAVATFQHTLMSIIRARFPLLADYVGHEIVLPDISDILNLLIVQLSSAPDERAARAILSIPTVE